MAATVAFAALGTTTAQAFDPTVEAENFGKGNERSAIYNTPEYRALLTQVSAQNQQAALALQAADPERNFTGHLCASRGDGCAGDVRLYDWQAKGYGIVQPVLFTARSGATISGTVWATKAGPAKRPGIVITNGSVQAGETLYWFAAQTLAKAGYVVLTSDPQGQGQSDERGEAPDSDEGSPAQSDGRPFYDGTTDALDFFLSTPDKPFVPRKSCNTGTSHAPKQERRVKAGLNTAFNPFHALVDPSRIGIAGHSFGAAGVSYIGQKDPRVKAIVAWDNLGAPVANDGGRIGAKDCPADPSERAPAAITKPALGMSADYFIPPTPNTGDPDPLGKSVQSRKYSEAKVDTGELVIRGGTHYDFDWIPNQGFPATLRGADMITWYTTAWFDKYVKGDATADQRLTTDRWRADADEAAVDPHQDGNMFSFYYRSRLDIGLANGGRFTCEDMRPGCAGLTSGDGQPGKYDYLSIVTSKDGAGNGPSGTGIRGCKPANRTVRLRYGRKTRIVRADVYINGKRVQTTKGKSLKKVVIPPAGNARHTVKIVLRTSRGKRLTSVRTYNGCKKTKPRRVKR
jgi:dienelactone hydrolase